MSERPLLLYIYILYILQLLAIPSQSGDPDPSGFVVPPITQRSSLSTCDLSRNSPLNLSS